MELRLNVNGTISLAYMLRGTSLTSHALPRDPSANPTISNPREYRGVGGRRVDRSDDRNMREVSTPQNNVTDAKPDS